MKGLFVLLFCTGLSASVISQSRAGITGVRDSSYSLGKELEKQQKYYPGIELVLPSGNISHITKNIPYCQTPERNLLLDIYQPKQSSAPKRTALIFIHGGGWRSGNKEMHETLLEKLAARGYVCISPEYRLSTEALYPAGVHDIKSAIRWTRAHAKEYNIDPDKIVVAGHSAGGELAAMMGATNNNPAFEGAGCFLNNSSQVNAVIDLDGTLAFIHPESGEGDDSRKTSAATYWFGYSKSENPERWKEAAPLTHAGPHCPSFLFINSGVDRMHAGREDFIRILNHSAIYSAVKTFNGSPHSFLFFRPWFDSTVIEMDRFIKNVFPAGKSGSRKITVAADGTGDFTRVQAAILAVPDHNTIPVTIFIKNGIYKEKIYLDSLKPFITLVGEDQDKTILTNDDHTGKISASGATINTRTSWSFKCTADHFSARNITFSNDAGFNAGQAVALESNGDQARFINCRFTGFQDVLLIDGNKSRQYFRDCYIEGTTDFIFGSATAWFENCTIYSKKNSHITAASTPAGHQFGYVFNNCRLEGDTSLHLVSLGRPWRPYANVVYLTCYLGPHIRPEGWSTWNDNENHKTAYYAEYKNRGPGAINAKRLNWTRQLTKKEARRYRVTTVLQGWNPEKE